MHNKGNTTLIFCLSTATVLITLGAFIFFFKVIENKNKHTSNVLITLANKEKQKENNENLIKQISEVSDTKSQIDSYFVDPNKIDSFINYLENLGTESGANLKVKGFETKIDSGNSLNVKVSAKGTFNNVISTLMLIEDAPYKLMVTDVRMSQNYKQEILDEKGEVKQAAEKEWEAEITFNVLLSV